MVEYTSYIFRPLGTLPVLSNVQHSLQAVRYQGNAARVVEGLAGSLRHDGHVAADGGALRARTRVRAVVAEPIISAVHRPAVLWDAGRLLHPARQCGAGGLRYLHAWTTCVGHRKL